jgi:hypothetical protein
VPTFNAPEAQIWLFRLTKLQGSLNGEGVITYKPKSYETKEP